jgi:tetratricopeptide (TPR) repeat protein
MVGDEEEPVTKSREAYEQVKKQIASIAESVSKGRDARARRFLGELIREQTSFSGGENYAVKSLCNVAQRCADMFRTDFEAVCLDKALQLDPFNAWALIQYGNHLKRVGNYVEALSTFERAEQLGQNVVAKASVADVYSQQGDYPKAVLTYKAIPNWNNEPKVLTAVADNLRRMGRMPESEAAYTNLIRLAKEGLPEFADSEHRALAGIAEVAKGQGRLVDALKIYRQILEGKDLDDRDVCIHKLALCNILKLMDEFVEAYEVVDTVIQEYPFCMQARFIRGSILGLIGKEQDGLKDLPESSVSRSWREWLRRYYRGLLLLKLKRYGDAKKNLVEELPKAIASGEEKAILRMAAALWFLREGQTPEADGILSEIPDLYDCHTEYLSLVLKLHSATQKKDLATMDSLRERIAGLQVVDARLDKAVVALREGNFSLALTYETDALLKLAA